VRRKNRGAGKAEAAGGAEGGAEGTKARGVAEAEEKKLARK
jgi:hypothetical protein